ncbi:MAG: class I SAM-dependent methyltransferase [Saprospiraceae bacterium]|nr:class I SAM-dependent methyltransferase [Saprospiraceae bacterium]
MDKELFEFEAYAERNKLAWNKRVGIHLESAFYDQKGFLAGQNTLFGIEKKLLGDIHGKSIIHLQCHFGQDTISLSRMGAKVTGLDISDKAIETARQAAIATGQHTEFICCHVYDLPTEHFGKYDIVFSSYGTITWLPDLNKWAQTVSNALKVRGRFIFSEFHPMVWIYDDQLSKMIYDYFNSKPIYEVEKGSYADRNNEQELESITWNHSLDEVVTALLQSNLKLVDFREYDYSPCNFMPNMQEFEPGKFRFNHISVKIPLVYSLVMEKY